MSNATSMPCPVCKVPLMMSDRQGVEIDYCPQCRGVWLDRGELDKIIERNNQASAPPAPSAPPPQQGYAPQLWGNQGYPQHGKPYGHHKRRKSFLEEIFD